MHSTPLAAGHGFGLVSARQSSTVPAGFVPGDGRYRKVALHIVVTAAVLVACATALTWRVYEPAANHDAVAVWTGLVVIGLIGYVRYGLGVPWLSAPVVYLLLFWLFHFGLTFTAVFVPDLLILSDDRFMTWVHYPNVRLAMLLGVIGAAGFVTGLGWARGWSAPAVDARDDGHEPVMYGVGWLIMLAGLGVSVLTLVGGGGLGVFALGYQEFRQTLLRTTDFMAAIQVSQLGCLLALCGAGGGRWIRPFAVWMFIPVVLLLLGFRGPAMIPILTFLVVLAYRGVRIRRSVVAAGVAGALLVIPAIREFRAVGFINRAEVDWTEVSPLRSIAELGGTLRAVKAYVDWIEEGDPYLLGASYWAPLDRHLLAWVVPGREQLSVEDDIRVPAAQMTAREGSVGSAATGEAYYNFGPSGPFFYFACLGVLFGWLERRPLGTRYSCALLGVAMLLFFWNVRGQWIQVPAQAAFALIIVGGCYVFRRPESPVVRRRAVAARGTD